MAGMEGLPKVVADRILSEFKRLDKDGDLKVSKEEYENSIIKRYVDDGYQIKESHTQGETIGNILSGADQKFDVANTDKDLGGLNIDEFTNLVKDKYLAEYEEEKEKNDILNNLKDLQKENEKNTKQQPDFGL